MQATDGMGREEGPVQPSSGLFQNKQSHGLCVLYVLTPSMTGRRYVDIAEDCPCHSAEDRADSSSSNCAFMI